MKYGFFSTCGIFASSMMLTSNLYATASKAETDIEQIVISPTCLLENANIPFQELAKKDDFLLIKAKLVDLAILREQKPRAVCGSFRDVTTEWEKLLATQKTKLTSQNIKNIGVKFLSNEFQNFTVQTLNMQTAEKLEISHEQEVTKLLSYFDAQRLWQDLLTLTSFENRYAVSDNGVKAAEWFKTQAQSIAKSVGRTDITMRFIATGGSYKQPSLVVTVPGTDPTLEAVLLGGHIDTLNGAKPGADDDGTGAVTVLEVMRAVLNSKMPFKRTMYFVWYAAEEQGLVGSNVVTADFRQKQIPLRGVLHLDMTGYQAKPENKIWMIDDYTNVEMSNFVSDLAVNYAKTAVGHTKCGYACSDHASWTQKGYRSAMPFETKFGEDSPYIHTSADTPSTVSLEHMSRFAKISIAFLGELGEAQFYVPKN